MIQIVSRFSNPHTMRSYLRVQGCDKSEIVIGGMVYRRTSTKEDRGSHIYMWEYSLEDTKGLFSKLKNLHNPVGKKGG